jgi:hypothetical protein
MSIKWISLNRGSDGVSSLGLSDKRPGVLTVVGNLPHGVEISPRDEASRLRLIEWLESLAPEYDEREREGEPYGARSTAQSVPVYAEGVEELLPYGGRRKYVRTHVPSGKVWRLTLRMEDVILNGCTTYEQCLARWNQISPHLWRYELI